MSEKDPWDRSRHDEPPGLDEVFNSIFGSGGSDKGPAAAISSLIMGLIIVTSLLFLVSGFFIVAPAEHGVVLRFGQLYRTAMPGPNWSIPIVDKRYIVDVFKVNEYTYTAEMLTKDEIYAEVSVSVYHRIGNPENYLFASVDPLNALTQATASALRQVVGNSNLNALLSKDRVEIREEISSQLKQILDSYKIGIEITDVKLQNARPPSAVKPAYDDVIQAREDQHRYTMQAEGYSNKVIGLAEGEKRRIINEADAQYERIILESKAKVATFDALVSQYKRNPDIMKNRMYLDTMEHIFSQVAKVFVPNEGMLNVLPLSDIISKESQAREKE